DENQMTLQLGVPRQVDDPLDVALPVVVARMSFPGEDELDRTLPIVRQLDHAIELLEDQRRALVRGKTPRESDRQRIRVEEVVEGDEVRLTEPLPLQQEAPARELDQLAAQRVAHGPDLLVGHEVTVEHPRPEARGVDASLPVGAELALPELADRTL